MRFLLMSIRLEADELKLIAVLHNSRQLERLNSFFKRELDNTTNALIKAGPDLVQRIQGRAQLLNDLLEAFDKRSIKQEI